MKKIGILGGGQLARMLTLAAYPLGLTTICYESEPATCASDVTTVITAAYDNEQELRKFAKQMDVITYETENIPAATLKIVSEHCPIAPNLAALQVSQDRWLEKNFFTQLQIPTVPFHNVTNLAELHTAVAMLGLPAVLKTRRFGYDGKGQIILRQNTDIELAWEQLKHSDLILEKYVHFEREVSLIAVRHPQGEIAHYPLTENLHRNGVLYLSQAPHKDPTLQRQAEHYLTQILNHLNYVGVLSVEFFVVEEQLLANEMAPRVHNSGHWTIEGADCSQFENHIRAICGFPLGSTQSVGYSAMFNCLGTMPDRSAVLAISQAHLHDYNKTPRPGRKVGHVTVMSPEYESFRFAFKAMQALSSGSRSS